MRQRDALAIMRQRPSHTGKCSLFSHPRKETPVSSVRGRSPMLFSIAMPVTSRASMQSNN
jgi:hypothetical protein